MTVSVVLPTYNRARFLPEALQSVLDQTHEDFELLVIDDGSTDETPAILGAVSDPRVRVIRLQQNMGRGKARNRGLEEATGEFIAFLDSDDLWLPDSLGTRLAVFRDEPEVDLVFADLARFTGDQVFSKTQFDFVTELRVRPARPAASGTGRVLLDHPLPALLQLPQFATWLQTVVVRREIVEDGARFPGRRMHGEDSAFMLQVYLRARKAAFVDEVVAHVRRHASNSYDSPTGHQYSKARLLTATLEDPLFDEWHEVIARKLGKQWTTIGYHRFWEGEPLRAGAAYLRALVHPEVRMNALKHLAALPVSLLVRLRVLPPRHPSW